MKSYLKKIIPTYLLDLRQKWRYQQKHSTFNDLNVKEVFDKIYEEKHWGAGESISGPGSSVQVTAPIVSEINDFLQAHQLTSVVDIPCGDFNWMQQIDFTNIQYIGGDIVGDLILQNTKQYANDTISFQQLNIITDPIPPADLLISRDCLVHFSFDHIHQTIKNIKQSECRYLMTTTFQKVRLNYDIQTGDWRPINLEIAPFNLPQPVLVMEEKKANDRGKVLAVWKIEEL